MSIQSKGVCLVTGVNGQDGSYLSDLLLEKGYEVHGLVRRHSVAETQDWRIKHLQDKMETHYGDLLDPLSIADVLNKCKPDLVFNLAAQSHVGISSKLPSFTVQVNSIGFLNVIEQVRQIVPHARVYQASSSEMFGNSITDGKQNEDTPMHPVSPYGCSKLFSYHLARHYRNAYGMFVSNGILFNHECLKYDYPLLVKYNNNIMIMSCQDIAKQFAKHIDNDKDNKSGTKVDDLYVWDNNNWTKVKYISWFLNTNKKLKIINARNAVYSVSEDHICFKENFVESRSDELNVGDKLQLIDYPDNCQNYNITLEEAELLGLLIGDGSTNHRIQFTNKNKNVLNRCKYLWEKITSGISSYYPSKSGFTGQEVGRLDLHNDDSNWLSNFSLYSSTRDVFGHQYKQIPFQILNSNKDIMEAFLCGYNQCDGLKSTKLKYKFQNFKTNSPILAAGLLFLVSKVTGQKYNITVEESQQHGKQQFYYSINLLSNNQTNTDRYNKIQKIKQDNPNISQRELSRQTGISRTFIRKIENGYIPGNTHHLEKINNEIKKIITIESYNYQNYWYDLETESGTFHAGIGQGIIHNSPRRGGNFVTKKIVQAAKAIKTGTQDKLVLGNIDSMRDWGHSKDYVRAMLMILEHDRPDDFVVATGHTHTIREFLELVFRKLDLSVEDHVITNSQTYLRAQELNYLCGDSTKIRRTLGWEPEYDLEMIVEDMLNG